MKKLILVITVFLVGCDPIYHLNYVVTNSSDRSICITDEPDYDSVKNAIILHPGKTDTVHRTSSIGYARPVFEANKPEMSRRILFYSDTIMVDSALFVPEREWIYTEENRCKGQAMMIIRNSDLTH